eukprot:TRINITY_DN1_c0_g3_i1.p1 TRINITY_DN1_c0_g3~~TRINITY_DN1_c0_g3_i1.p1  ORF type:complete len:183 (-),score=44.21 TRINITY_DN1_c0_g3_i1:82-630(-)
MSATTYAGSGTFSATTDSNHPLCKFWPSYLPSDPSTLFIIERSKNGNVVQYKSVLDAAGTALNSAGPITGEWWTNGWTDKPYREDLGFFEKKAAYGWTFAAAEDEKDAYTVSLVSLPSRKLTLSYANSIAIAKMQLNGKMCRLWKLYVNTTEGALGPKVNYVELYGTTLDDAATVEIEQIKP